MFKIDENYSDYYMNDPVKYPGGGAVNSSGPDAIDGTPWLAKIFNNSIGWMQALYIKAFGSLEGISNDAENVQTSDVVSALEKIQTDNNTAQRTISDEKYLPMEGSAASAKKLTTARKVYVKLGTASTSETKDFSGDTAIPVDGTLAVANGGTGSSNAAGARSNLGLGSAAVKTAGSAAGNVPLVGTALGTTDKNIVVTDTSGQLKPSGTVIGSAAGKTAGSAAGNVPEVGTALGTTNNNILVTDANGKLKPSGTTIGSAAGKTAGSAAGNVPEVGTALGTTNNNILVTDANGKLKPSGTTIGSAAGKTAGSAAGNVPEVGTALGTTDKNIVVTDSAGKLKPSGTVIGSAAGKTAGSAAGNVPEVGTALGTTDKNIVVTDSAGKLKPSGTVIGSAAGKTAGSAAGNVPLVGTALGTTDKNIVVTDTSGQLKPSGTVIGSAAGKTAGSAAGNVPLVGTALGTTDNNLLVTNASGQMKPFGKTPDQIAYWGNGGAVCATAAATGAKTVSITGFTLYTGVTVKVMFTNGNSNNAPTLNVNSTGAKNIKVVKAGAKITPPVHTGKWRGASSATTEAWQPLTILELMYDGTDWVIIGNPVVEDYSSTDQSYTVYANGLIEQQGEYSSNGNTLVTTSFYIKYLNNNNVLISGYSPSRTSEAATDNLTMYSKSLESFKTGWNNHHSNEWKVNWFATGY